MAKDASFDIVSETNLEEVKNAIQMVKKEIDTRFDFKGTISEVKLEKDQLVIISESEFKLEQVKDILTNKLVKRDISSKNLHFEKVEKAFGGNVRQTADLVHGIDKENAKKITQLIKQAELKVKTQIQDDQIRVTGKNRDDLQKVMSLLREANLPISLQFTNCCSTIFILSNSFFDNLTLNCLNYDGLTSHYQLRNRTKTFRHLYIFLCLFKF